MPPSWGFGCGGSRMAMGSRPWLQHVAPLGLKTQADVSHTNSRTTLAHSVTELLHFVIPLLHLAIAKNRKLPPIWRSIITYWPSCLEPQRGGMW